VNLQTAQTKRSATPVLTDLSKGKENMIKNQNTLKSNKYNLKALFGYPFLFQSYHYKAGCGSLVLSLDLVFNVLLSVVRSSRSFGKSGLKKKYACPKQLYITAMLKGMLMMLLENSQYV